MDATNALPNVAIWKPIPKSPFANHAAKYSNNVFTTR